MCRVLTYLGEEILIENLFYNTDNSLIKQSYNPNLMTGLLNLAGFGFSSWKDQGDHNEKNFIYKTTMLPFYDKNLRNISSTIKANCVLAHVRGVFYSEREVISVENVHPFLYEGTNIAFAHNGGLFNFNVIKDDILKYIKYKFKSQIHGTTDSELIYALFISQFDNPENETSIEDIFTALFKTISILYKLRKKNNIVISSPFNLFISNGKVIVATRFVFDYGHYNIYQKNFEIDTIYNSLWYTYGHKYSSYENQFQMTKGRKNNSIIISSEPLTKDTTTWVEVPEYSFIGAGLDQKEIKIQSLDIII